MSDSLENDGKKDELWLVTDQCKCKTNPDSEYVSAIVNGKKKYRKVVVRGRCTICKKRLTAGRPKNSQTLHRSKRKIVRNGQETTVGEYGNKEINNK